MEISQNKVSDSLYTSGSASSKEVWTGRMYVLSMNVIPQLEHINTCWRGMTFSSHRHHIAGPEHPELDASVRLEPSLLVVHEIVKRLSSSWKPT